MRTNIARHQRAIHKACGDHAGPIRACRDHLDRVGTNAHTATVVTLTNAVVRDIGRLGDQLQPDGTCVQRHIAEHPQGLGQIRAIDLGDFHKPVAIQIRSTRDRQPTKWAADKFVCVALHKTVIVIHLPNSQPCADKFMGFDHIHLWRAIAIQIDHTGYGVLKHDQFGPNGNAFRPIGKGHAKPRMFNIIP